MEGLWAMIARKPMDELQGAGVLYVHDNKVHGGDNGFFWFGTLDRAEGGVLGTLKVVRYIKGALALFPEVNHLNDYTIKVRGGYHPEKFSLTISVVGRDDLNATLELRRVA